MGDMQILELRNVRVSCANALNGQIASGFPAVSAFLGFVKALERKLIAQAKRHYASEGYGTFEDRTFLEGVGIICSHNEPQVLGTDKLLYPVQRGRTETAYNPKDYCSPSIVRESYTNMTVTLLVGVHGLKDDEGEIRFIATEPAQDGFVQAVKQIAPFLRMAGGTIEHIEAIKLHDTKEGISVPYGYALVSAEDELAARIAALTAQDSEATAIDALLSPYLDPICYKDETIARKQKEWAKKTGDDLEALKKAAKENKPERDAYQAGLLERRKLAGLGQAKPSRHFVAMQTGFVVVSAHEGGTVANARDTRTPFLFTEPLHGLNEWVPVSALKTAKDISRLLWTYSYPHARLSDGAEHMPRIGDMITFTNSHNEA